MNNLLFGQQRLTKYLATNSKNTIDSINRTGKQTFQEKTVEELSDELYQHHKVVTPELLEPRTFQKAPIDVKHNGAIVGTQFEIVLPYSGDQYLFQTTPSRFNYNPPCASVDSFGLHFIYQLANGQDSSSIMINYKQSVATVKQWLSWVQSDVDAYNIALKRDISVLLLTRKNKLDGDSDTAGGLGFPIK